jgi:hypothetical protein
MSVSPWSGEAVCKEVQVEMILVPKLAGGLDPDPENGRWVRLSGSKFARLRLPNPGQNRDLTIPLAQKNRIQKELVYVSNTVNRRSP